ncbi:MAG TPA: SRPBCC family protein [Thermoanaerobaculia bacterium]|nr:SRPBCC family protein [Thermoanaerobaculia bacterium]
MKIALIIVGLLIVAAAAIAAIGALLPRTHEVSRSAVLPVGVANVYDVIADREKAPEWRIDLKRVEMLGLQNGRVHFREHGTDGSITYEIVEAIPAHRFVTRIVDRNLGYSGSWTYVLEPEGSGTRLTITEKGEVSNVIFRFMSRFVFGHTRTIDTYLAALSRHLKPA